MLFRSRFQIVHTQRHAFHDGFQVFDGIGGCIVIQQGAAAVDIQQPVLDDYFFSQAIERTLQNLIHLQGAACCQGAFFVKAGFFTDSFHNPQ